MEQTFTPSISKKSWDAGPLASEEDVLLEQAIQGNADAFGLIYEKNAEAIYRFINGHVYNSLDAEDLTVEVFLRAWRSLPRYKRQGVPFIAYLFRIARNAVTDHYRHTSKNQDDLQIDDVFLQDTQPQPLEAVMVNMQRQEVMAMLDQLRDEHRTVLLLRFIADLSPEETGEAMGKSPGAVRALQFRALRALRKYINGSEEA
ncbi:MAG TPA: sigma-70 family RNA polymerase sigma factor [Anaerolineales bacterium]|nr:sigma-70 family RNA polymerase sigma factor [Anaerolineales bacterium]